MLRRATSIALLFLLQPLTTARVQALEPQQVFEKASPSVVTVVTLDATGDVVGFGSGVVIAPNEVITNCHVVAIGAKFRVKKGRLIVPARVRFYDDKRDLCQLHADQAAPFTHPIRGIVAIDDLQVGQRVYAIGAPQGLELTLSDGLISGLRQTEDGSIQLIQTSAPISPGSSGGGLFDQDGRLVGITTFLLRESQNLNFALPASWVLELSSRAPDLVEQRRRAIGEAFDEGIAKAKAEEEKKQMAAAAAELARRESELRTREEELRRREQQAQASDVVTTMPTPPAPVVRAPLPTPPRLKRGDEDAALKRFTQDIWRIVGKEVTERDYPRVARDQGWEGLTKVRIEIGSDGLLKTVTVTRSSGYPVLDDRAVAKMQEIRLPNIPDELRERAFSVDVPFRFSLRKGEQ